ncbi:MAG: hypothetical protein JXR46_12500 [Calditrichaceae bacterium]|nr:hypothetical protein [Calditrichaceae bacterium]
MKKFLFFSLILSILLIIAGCEKSDQEKGIEAFQADQYLDAINYLYKSYQIDSIQFNQHEILALAFLYRGNELYGKTKNVKSFQGNIDEAKKFIRSNASDSLMSEYRKSLILLAQAYRVAKPKSDLERENFFSRALDNLNECLAIDSTDTEALRVMEEIKIDNFQALLDKANSAYERAGRTRDYSLYNTAEYYVKQAAQMDSKHPDVRNLISKIRMRTVNILDPREGLSFAIYKELYEKKFYILLTGIKNYWNRPVKINVDNFELMDVAGNKYTIDKRELEGRRIFGHPSITDTTLTPGNPFIEAELVFGVPEKVYLKQLIYHINDSDVKVKYFR